MIRRPPRSTPLYSSAASDVYKRQGRRRAHLARVLWSLRKDTGGGIGVRYGNLAGVVLGTAREIGATVVWAQQEYSPSAIREQELVRLALDNDGRHLRLIGSPYAVAPGRVLKGDGAEYQVFTPFRRAWRDHGLRRPAATADPDGLVPISSDIDLNQEAALGDLQDPLGYPPPFIEDCLLHISEPTRLRRISYAVFCLKKK